MIWQAEGFLSIGYFYVAEMLLKWSGLQTRDTEKEVSAWKRAVRNSSQKVMQNLPQKYIFVITGFNQKLPSYHLAFNSCTEHDGQPSAGYEV